MNAFRSSAGKISLYIVVAQLVLAFGLGWFLGSGSQTGHDAPEMQHAADADHTEHAEHDHAAAPAEETVWTCSMHPQIQLPEEGQCPICFMDLIPLVKGGDEEEQISLRQIGLSATARKLAQVTLAPVERRSVAAETRMVGKVEYDQTRMGAITAWTGGRIDKLYVDAEGDIVKRGRAMASIYSPELLTAQAELIEAEKTLQSLGDSSFKLVRDTAERTKKAAMEKLRLLGLSKGQIEGMLEKGEARDHVTLYAPMGGVVIEKMVVEGEYVTTGMPIYKIADLSKVWVVLGAYESDLPWIEEGGKVSFTVESMPGRVFTGKVIFIDQVLDEKTRTVDVRLEADNPGFRLKPGMLVKAVQRRNGDTEEQEDMPLVIPASAPLITGKRAVVYVAVPDKEGVYEGREIVLGPRAGDSYVVKEGLSQGDMVVVKGNFKIDSALQIMAKPSMMNPSVGAVPAQGHGDHGDHAAMDDVEKAAPMPMFEAPELMVSKLAAAAETYRGIDEKLEAGDFEAARSAYSAFYDEICAIDPTELEGEAALHWRELSTLLRNDAVLAKEARDMRRLKKIHAESEVHFANLAMTFPTTVPEGPKIYATPEEFQDQLGKVYVAYSKLMEALAADDFDTAKQGAAETAHALSQVDMGLLEHEPHMAWMKHLNMMNDGLAAIRDAGDITAVRSGFEPLSIAFIEAVETLGVNVDGELYVHFCPMAFDNKGADWLQQDEEVRNPYFGAAMYRCGLVKRQVNQQAHAE